MAGARYQLVICDGPRCGARGKPADLWRDASALRASEGWSLRLDIAAFTCLGRCPAGPNVLVRTLDEGDGEVAAPGLFDLDGACHYWSVDRGALERILRAHCERGEPLPGRHQRY